MTYPDILVKYYRNDKLRAFSRCGGILPKVDVLETGDFAILCFCLLLVRAK